MTKQEEIAELRNLPGVFRLEPAELDTLAEYILKVKAFEKLKTKFFIGEEREKDYAGFGHSNGLRGKIRTRAN